MATVGQMVKQLLVDATQATIQDLRSIVHDANVPAQQRLAASAQLLDYIVVLANIDRAPVGKATGGVTVEG